MLIIIMIMIIIMTIIIIIIGKYSKPTVTSRQPFVPRIAPETWKGLSGAPSDIWSVGLIAFVLLSRFGLHRQLPVSIFPQLQNYLINGMFGLTVNQQFVIIRHRNF